MHMKVFNCIYDVNIYGDMPTSEIIYDSVLCNTCDVISIPIMDLYVALHSFGCNKCI